MVGRAAPELRAVEVGPEAVVALRQCEDRLAGGVGGLVVAGVDPAGEGIDRQAHLGSAVGVLHRHRDRQRHHHGRRRASRHRAVVRPTAPELRPVQVGPEAVGAFRQSEARLAGGVGRAVEAGVGGPVEDVHREAGFRRAFGVLHRDRHRHGDYDGRVQAAGDGAVVGLPAPELGAARVGPEAVGPARQGAIRVSSGCLSH